MVVLVARQRAIRALSRVDSRMSRAVVRAFAPFARVVVAFRVRGLCASSSSVRATSRTRSAHIS